MEPKAGVRPDFIRMMPEMAKLMRARLVCLFKSLSFRALFLLLLLSHFSCVRLCATLKTAAHMLLCSWDSPGKNTGVGCHFLPHFRALLPLISNSLGHISHLSFSSSHTPSLPPESILLRTLSEVKMPRFKY